MNPLVGSLSTTTIPEVNGFSLIDTSSGVTIKYRHKIPNRDHPFNISETAEVNYLTLKKMVNDILLYTSYPPNDPLIDMVKQCQRQINQIDDTHLKHIFEYKNNRSGSQNRLEVPKEQINTVKSAIADITTTVDQIKTRVNEANADVIKESSNKLYVALGILLIGVAVGLTAFFSLPAAFPAVFIAGSKATIILECCAGALSTISASTGIGLGFYHGGKIQSAREDNNNWDEIHELFSKLRAYLEEDGGENAENMRQDCTQQISPLSSPHDQDRRIRKAANCS